MKLAIRLLGAIMMTLFLSIPAFASPRVVLDGQFLQFDTQPTIENGTTLVPLRQIFQSLGATITWDENTKKITAKKDATVITLFVGKSEAYVNNKKVTLTVPPKVINNRTLVPLRFISESLGADVDWDAAQQIAVITSPKEEPKTVEETKAVEKPKAVETTTPSQIIKVHFINVGNADAIYISLPNKKDILIDSGHDELYRDIPQKVVSYLKDQGVDDIDLLIASAPLRDYIGYLDRVFYNFQVKKLIDSGYAHPIKEYNDYINYSLNAQSREAANKQHFNFDGISFDVLTSPGYWKNEKDNSVVTKLTYNNVSFLFMGSATVEKAKNLTGNLSAKILKVADHGSKDSLSSEFLDKVKPETAVICVGANPYGNPDKNILTDLKSVKVYRTDESGNIIISTDGKSYNITTEINNPDDSPAPAQAQSTVTYIGDLETNVYHESTCPLVKDIKKENKVYFKYSFDAREKGFVPCKVCNP